MSVGHIAAQLVHAAGESSNRVPTGTYAIVLAVPNQAKLLALEKRLIETGVPHKAIREPDMDNELTAIGVEPGPRKHLRKILSNLPLLR
jgi:peptidyl-tRNA hydrolase